MIRVSEASARQLRFYGKNYKEALKALLEKEVAPPAVDYEKIRAIVNDEILKFAR